MDKKQGTRCGTPWIPNNGTPLRNWSIQKYALPGHPNFLHGSIYRRQRSLSREANEGHDRNHYPTSTPLSRTYNAWYNLDTLAWYNFIMLDTVLDITLDITLLCLTLDKKQGEVHPESHTTRPFYVTGSFKDKRSPEIQISCTGVSTEVCTRGYFWLTLDNFELNFRA